MPTRLLALAAAVVLLAPTAADTGPAPPRPPQSAAFHAASPQQAPVRPGAWDWPLGSPAAPPVVAAPFDAPETRWGAGHRGADLVAEAGQAVHAPAAGTVAFVGVVVDRPVLTIDHGGGLLTSFEPLASDLAVGARVEAGQAVGTIADGGHCGGSCLHWGLRVDGVYTDPLPTVRDLRPSILLPVP
ncbi:hypothetical protein GCM10022377_12790 [Zhihengliuella alba]|uniref:M23ase beta-sheet core domain-containing protein n=1 Tax=Zhihengliuella alba TaxID=547018 RepID=A0ABP7D7U5_9MICC